VRESTQSVFPQGEQRLDDCGQLVNSLITTIREKLPDRKFTPYQRDVLHMFTDDARRSFVAACWRAGATAKLELTPREGVPGKLLGLSGPSHVCASAWRAGWDAIPLERFAGRLLSKILGV
jgi:hypothetical protein